MCWYCNYFMRQPNSSSNLLIWFTSSWGLAGDLGEGPRADSFMEKSWCNFHLWITALLGWLAELLPVLAIINKGSSMLLFMHISCPSRSFLSVGWLWSTRTCCSSNGPTQTAECPLGCPTIALCRGTWGEWWSKMLQIYCCVPFPSSAKFRKTRYI